MANTPCSGDYFINKVNTLNPTKIFNLLGDNAVITCECIIPVCNERFSDPYASYTDTRLYFSHFISLLLFSYIDDSLEISYSTTNDESTYIKLDQANYTIDPPNGRTSNYLNIYINNPNTCIPTKDYDYTFVKTKFKIKVTNVNLFNNIESYLYTCFSLDYIDEHNYWQSYESELNLECPRFKVEKSNYLIEALGYSLNVCDSAYLNRFSSNKQTEFTKDFTAKFSFNGVNQYYENSYYVLTLKPSNGVEFPTTPYDLQKIKTYISIDKLYTNIEIPNNAIIDKSNLLITIPYGDIYNNIKNNNTYTINDINILVTIPYMVNSYTKPINTNFLYVNGSVDFTIIDTSIYKILTSLHSFCLSVNFNCPNITSVGKGLIC